jgi:hypothetical protein
MWWTSHRGFKLGNLRIWPATIPCIFKIDQQAVTRCERTMPWFNWRTSSRYCG